ncbi:MAG TPA: GAF and ANTAR domain-containing protein [Mycobacterium sp.]|uniref:GAF and ANTAR domain-containing protein n=1 Tax=Mycobacterium sp. TaxID=1785 RepID=UPI002F42911B
MVDVADEANGDSVKSPGTADPGTVFSALAEIIYQGSESSEVYAAICVAATLVVTGCDHASLLVRREGRYVTVGASDRIAQQVDDLERLAGDGPCVDAIEEETPQIESDLTAPTQWPKLAARMVAETPVRGAMSFRILVDKRKTGALNLFSDTPNVFDTQAAGQAVVLASFASVAINAVAQGEDVSTLRRGLLSNREIGKAVGMLMMLQGVDEQEAFNVLRRYSQDLNIKLADVARSVIENRGKPMFGEHDQSSPRP